MPNSYSIIGNIPLIKFKPRARLRYRKPKNGKKKHRYEALSYSDKNKDGKWVSVSRVFDRENDFYHEIIKEEETGKIIHEKHEPLSNHVGYGSAKKRK